MVILAMMQQMKKMMTMKNHKYDTVGDLRRIPFCHTLKGLDKMLLFHVMFEMGIIPIEDIEFDFRRILDQFTPEEARKSKRKFRKLWRKYRTRYDTGAVSDLDRTQRLRSKYLSNIKKLIVYEQIWINHILPLKEKLHIPKTT